MRVADRGVGPVGQVQAEDDADHDPDEDRDRERPDDPPGRDTERHEDAGQRDGDERQDAVQDAPAHRAEEPLAEEQRGPEDEQGDRDDDEDDAPHDECRDLGDLGHRSPGLGLGQVDVGHDEAERRVPGRLELGAESGRRAGASWRRTGRRSRRWPGRRSVAGAVGGPGGSGGPVGGIGVFGSSRSRLRAERMDVGVGPMIPARAERGRHPNTRRVPVRYAPPMTDDDPAPTAPDRRAR